MADSDNTTTLSLVTRRRAIVKTPIASARPTLSASAYSDLGASRSVGPAVARGADVGRLIERTEWVCRQHQCLEQTHRNEWISVCDQVYAGATMTIGQPIRQGGITHLGRWMRR